LDAGTRHFVVKGYFSGTGRRNLLARKE